MQVVQVHCSIQTLNQTDSNVHPTVFFFYDVLRFTGEFQPLQRSIKWTARLLQLWQFWVNIFLQ